MEENWCKITNSQHPMFGRKFQIKSENEDNYFLIDTARTMDFEIAKADCGVATINTQIGGNIRLGPIECYERKYLKYKKKYLLLKKQH